MAATTEQATLTVDVLDADGKKTGTADLPAGDLRRRRRTSR